MAEKQVTYRRLDPTKLPVFIFGYRETGMVSAAQERLETHGYYCLASFIIRRFISWSQPFINISQLNKTNECSVDWALVIQ